MVKILPILIGIVVSYIAALFMGCLLYTSQILYFALHLESSSFPKPLSARDEIAAFEAMKNGDMAARDKLIRHLSLIHIWDGTGRDDF